MFGKHHCKRNTSVQNWCYFECQRGKKRLFIKQLEISFQPWGSSSGHGETRTQQNWTTSCSSSAWGRPHGQNAFSNLLLFFFDKQGDPSPANYSSATCNILQQVHLLYFRGHTQRNAFIQAIFKSHTFIYVWNKPLWNAHLGRRVRLYNSIRHCLSLLPTLTLWGKRMKCYHSDLVGVCIAVQHQLRGKAMENRTSNLRMSPVKRNNGFCHASLLQPRNVYSNCGHIIWCARFLQMGPLWPLVRTESEVMTRHL